jgi:predicted dehydrogenase
VLKCFADIANDPDVDLVVSSVRVDRHASSLIPSVKAGKAVFVEWPIDANYSIAKELTDLVKSNNVRNVVGIQGSFSPVATKVKELIKSGDIGKVESSTIIATNRGGATRSSHIDYFVDKEVGGNMFTIAFGHSIEFITEGRF